MYNRFTAQITASVNKFIPLKPRRTDNQKPLWMNNYLQKIIVEKRKLYKQYKLSHNSQDHANYIKVKRECERKIRKQKRKNEMKISLDAKKNPRLFFSYIRNKKT